MRACWHSPVSCREQRRGGRGGSPPHARPTSCGAAQRRRRVHGRCGSRFCRSRSCFPQRPRLLAFPPAVWGVLHSTSSPPWPHEGPVLGVRLTALLQLCRSQVLRPAVLCLAGDAGVAKPWPAPGCLGRPWPPPGLSGWVMRIASLMLTRPAGDAAARCCPSGSELPCGCTRIPSGPAWAQGAPPLEESIPW